jgi:hypothetical protein
MMQAKIEERLRQFGFVLIAIKYDSPVCRQEVITVNMAATKQEKVFYVLDCAQYNSVTTVQRNSRTRFGKDPPPRKSILDWYRRFETTACLAKGRALAIPVFQSRTCSEFEKRSCVAKNVNFQSFSWIADSANHGLEGTT